jgi:hypothetical protein
VLAEGLAVRRHAQRVLRTRPVVSRPAGTFGGVMLTLFLLIAAVVCFGLATFGAGWGRVNFTALGLALFVITSLVAEIPSAG